MKEHHGSWPNDWSAVHAAYMTTPELRGPGPWQDVTNRVDMDFTVDPSRLTSQAVHRLIWLWNGKSHHWAGAEPNELIREYIAKHNAEPGKRE